MQYAPPDSRPCATLPVLATTTVHECSECGMTFRRGTHANQHIRKYCPTATAVRTPVVVLSAPADYPVNPTQHRQGEPLPDLRVPVHNPAE